MPTTHHQAAAGPPTPSMSVRKDASLTLKVRILRQRRPRDKAGKRPTGTPAFYLSARLAVKPHVVSLGTCNHFAISWHVCFTGSLLVTCERRFEVTLRTVLSVGSAKSGAAAIFSCTPGIRHLLSNPRGPFAGRKSLAPSSAGKQADTEQVPGPRSWPVIGTSILLTSKMGICKDSC